MEEQNGKMKNLLRVIPVVLIVAGATMLFEKPAYAYADPGSGLLAIQAFGSALVATGWYLRRRIYALLHRGAATKHSPEEHTPAKEGEGSSLS
jgi:hypothetical protein